MTPRTVSLLTLLILVIIMATHTPALAGGGVSFAAPVSHSFTANNVNLLTFQAHAAEAEARAQAARAEVIDKPARVLMYESLILLRATKLAVEVQAGLAVGAPAAFIDPANVVSIVNDLNALANEFE